jgi:hypothetical protein
VQYPVSCECGQVHRVSEGAAGTRFACDCGSTVAVPSLHVLRMQTGQAVLSPELLIEAALQNGELPTSSSCLACGRFTDLVAFVWAVCERAQVENPEWGLVPLALVFGWVVFWRSGQTRVLGRDKEYRLPIRLCERCGRRLRGRKLREAMMGEPLYARLLDKYPQAGLSLSRR